MMKDFIDFLKILCSNKITKPTKLGAALIIIILFLYYCLKWIELGLPDAVTPIKFACVAFVFFITALVFFHWQKTQRFLLKKSKSFKKVT